MPLPTRADRPAPPLPEPGEALQLARPGDQGAVFLACRGLLRPGRTQPVEALWALGAAWGQGYPAFWLLRVWGGARERGVPWGVPGLWGYGAHRAGAERMGATRGTPGCSIFHCLGIGFSSQPARKAGLSAGVP